MDSDPQLLEYAASHPVEWRESKRYLVGMAWKLYYYLWADMYRKRLTATKWVGAAFELPFIPEYYKAVTQMLVSVLVEQGKKNLPWAYEIYRAAKSKRS
jgi:hypothetical protein